MWWCIAFGIFVFWNLGEYYIDHKYGSLGGRKDE